MQVQQLLRHTAGAQPSSCGRAPLSLRQPPPRPCLRARSAAADGPQPQKQDGSAAGKPSASKPAESLNLAYESDKPKAASHSSSSKVIMESPVKTTGLHRAPLSGGVKTATKR
mgnify:CR=1 FL=1